MMEDNKHKIISIDDITKENILSDEVFFWLYDRPDEVSKTRDIHALQELAAVWKLKAQFDKIHIAFKPTGRSE